MVSYALHSLLSRKHLHRSIHIDRFIDQNRDLIMHDNVRRCVIELIDN